MQRGTIYAIICWNVCSVGIEIPSVGIIRYCSVDIAKVCSAGRKSFFFQRCFVGCFYVRRGTRLKILQNLESFGHISGHTSQALLVISVPTDTYPFPETARITFCPKSLVFPMDRGGILTCKRCKPLPSCRYSRALLISSWSVVFIISDEYPH